MAAWTPPMIPTSRMTPGTRSMTMAVVTAGAHLVATGPAQVSTRCDIHVPGQWTGIICCDKSQGCCSGVYIRLASLKNYIYLNFHSFRHLQQCIDIPSGGLTCSF